MKRIILGTATMAALLFSAGKSEAQVVISSYGGGYIRPVPVVVAQPVFVAPLPPPAFVPTYRPSVSTFGVNVVPGQGFSIGYSRFNHHPYYGSGFRPYTGGYGYRQYGIRPW